LRAQGHDILAINEDPATATLSDPQVLELAASTGRIVVTFNVQDFEPLLRQWGEAGQGHPGCILVQGIRHDDFGTILRGLERHFAARPMQEDWINLAMYLSPSQAR